MSSPSGRKRELSGVVDSDSRKLRLGVDRRPGESVGRVDSCSPSPPPASSSPRSADTGSLLSLFPLAHDFPLPSFPLSPLAMDGQATEFSTLQQAAYPHPAAFPGGEGGGAGAQGPPLVSPPIVPLPGLPGQLEGVYTQAQHYSPAQPRSETPLLSPTSAFGTPALSTVSSSHDTLLSSLATPASAFPGSPALQPGVYLASTSPQPGGQGGGGAFYPALAPDGSGLGLHGAHLGALHPGAGAGMGSDDLKPAAVELPTPPPMQSMSPSLPGRLEGMSMSPQPTTGHRRTTSTVRPPETPRKGEDLGLELGDFDLLETLGTGTFGRVLLARLRPDPRKRPGQTQPHFFAMKVLEKNTIVRLRQVEHVNSERATLAHIRHPFVVNLFCTFQDESNLYLLLEYVQGGELFSHLRRAGRFSADVARFYAANLVLALEHLHKHDIIYRDLKPENLLIDASGHLKMTDFGFAKYVPERTYTLCGTPEYLAPEIITATGHSSACDWWALGVLLFELLAGYPPFFADNPLEIYEKILQGRFGVPAHVDPLAKDLIRRLLTADLSKRLGNLKGGAQDVKNHPWFEGVDWSAVSRKEIRAPIIPLTAIPGDVSNFERFPQTSIESMPGVLRAMSKRKYGFEPERGEDAYGYLFPSF
ncbi:hypothetical protein JCM10207_000163 [Rhodosporidiobolus poonsookiae]